MLSIHRLATRRSAVTLALGLGAALLVIIHMGWQLFVHWTGHDYVFGLVKLFHLDEERNIPTLFSTLLLLFAVVLLVHVRRGEIQRASRDAAKWTVLAAGFLYMAIDEFGHLHEMLIVPLRQRLGDGALHLLYYAWVLPAMAIVLVLAVYFIGFLWRLPAATRLGFLAGGALFVGGAIGIEMLEGRQDALYGDHNLTYVVYVMIEESMEMAGVIVFIHTLLQYIDQHMAPAPAGEDRSANGTRRMRPRSHLRPPARS